MTKNDENWYVKQKFQLLGPSVGSIRKEQKLSLGPTFKGRPEGL